MRLFELFDAPYDAKLAADGDGDGDYVKHLTLPDGSFMYIEFSAYSKNCYEVEFTRNYQYDVTNEGDAYKIFATVLKTIVEFIERVNPIKISFSADKDHDEHNFDPGPIPDSNGRIKLYDRMVSKYAAKLGYTLERGNYARLVVYLLTRAR